MTSDKHVRALLTDTERADIEPLDARVATAKEEVRLAQQRLTEARDALCERAGGAWEAIKARAVTVTRGGTVYVVARATETSLWVSCDPHEIPRRMTRRYRPDEWREHGGGWMALTFAADDGDRARDAWLAKEAS